jgi:hypothetical protein
MKTSESNVNHLLRGGTLRALATLMFCLPLNALAADGLSYEVNAGGGYTDNITRSATDEQDETIATAGVKLSYGQESAHVTTDVVGDLDFFNYLQNTYDSELIGTVLGKFDVSLVDDRLHWFVTDSFGQVLGDPFLPSTPANRDNLNYATTGLTTNIGLGSQMRLNAGASYSLASYENLPFDSNTVLGDLGLTRLLSDSNSIGLNLRASKVEFEEDALSSSNYDLQEAVLRYMLNSARMQVKLDAGYAQIGRDVGGDDGNLLFRFDFSRQLSPRSTVLFSAGQEYSNSAAAFATERAGAPVTPDTLSGRQTSDAFTHRYASASWGVSGRRTQLDLTGSWNDEEYDFGSLLDQSLTAFGLSVRRDLTAALSAEIYAQYGKGEFKALGDYDETRSGFSLRWQFARTLSLAITYDHNQRDSETAAGQYTENRFWLTFGYQHGAPRSRMTSSEFDGDAGL